MLPGVVALYREGAYVGQGRMPMLTPGDSADPGFGADDRVRVEYAPVKNKENEPTWYGQTKTQTREFKTQVRNLHDFAVRAVVTDQGGAFFGKYGDHRRNPAADDDAERKTGRRQTRRDELDA